MNFITSRSHPLLLKLRRMLRIAPAAPAAKRIPVLINGRTHYLPKCIMTGGEILSFIGLSSETHHLNIKYYDGARARVEPPHNNFINTNGAGKHWERLETVSKQAQGG